MATETLEQRWPAGALVQQTGYACVFTVVGYWRGNVILAHEDGPTHHAPESELTLVAETQAEYDARIESLRQEGLVG
jgi:hypothetical protein